MALPALSPRIEIVGYRRVPLQEERVNGQEAYG